MLASSRRHGFLVGVGLLRIFVPNPCSGDCSPAILRFIPYVGPCRGVAAGADVAAISPAGSPCGSGPGAAAWVSIDQQQRRSTPPLRAENSMLDHGILVAAVFWTGCGDRCGLLLRAPLTVCVVVLGSTCPQLRFLNGAVVDEPPLPLEPVLSPAACAMSRPSGLGAGASLRQDRRRSLRTGVLIPASHPCGARPPSRRADEPSGREFLPIRLSAMGSRSLIRRTAEEGRRPFPGNETAGDATAGLMSASGQRQCGQPRLVSRFSSQLAGARGEATVLAYGPAPLECCAGWRAGGRAVFISPLAALRLHPVPRGVPRPSSPFPLVCEIRRAL